MLANSIPFGSVQIQMGKFVSETTAARIASTQRINWAMMYLETLILRHVQTPNHVRRKTEQDTWQGWGNQYAGHTYPGIFVCSSYIKNSYFLAYFPYLKKQSTINGSPCCLSGSQINF
jgi:hypothetical protein